MALIKKAKNNQGTADSWCGHVIQPDEYYTIPENRWSQWAHDNKVLSDIANNQLIINNGDTDLSSIDAQISHLRAYVEGEKVYNIPANEYGMQMAAVTMDINVNSTNYVDLKLENYTNFPNTGQNESFTYKYIWGGYCMVTNAEFGDYGRFQIVDIDNILGYGAGFVVKEYIKKVWIFPNQQMQFVTLAPGQIPVGLYMRCYYTAINQGSTRTLYLNYDIETKD